MELIRNNIFDKKLEEQIKKLSTAKRDPRVVVYRALDEVMRKYSKDNDYVNIDSHISLRSLDKCSIFLKYPVFVCEHGDAYQTDDKEFNDYSGGQAIYFIRDFDDLNHVKVIGMEAQK